MSEMYAPKTPSIFFVGKVDAQNSDSSAELWKVRDRRIKHMQNNEHNPISFIKYCRSVFLSFFGRMPLFIFLRFIVDVFFLFV